MSNRRGAEGRGDYAELKHDTTLITVAVPGGFTNVAEIEGEIRFLTHGNRSTDLPYIDVLRFKRCKDISNRVGIR
jgi:hypothetical protein